MAKGQRHRGKVTGAGAYINRDKDINRDKGSGVTAQGQGHRGQRRMEQGHRGKHVWVGARVQDQGHRGTKT